MPRVKLSSNPYSGKSIIASGQERVNLYAELNTDPNAPVQVTHYLTPGTSLFSLPSIVKKARGSYRTSLGTAFYVVGQNVYFLTSTHNLVFIGAIADRQSQVYMVDNGLVCVLVDGLNGYVIDLPTNTIGIITDPNFYPADFVVLLDTFFIFNRAGTTQFFISISNASYVLLTTTGAFDPLDIAAKAGFNDPIVGITAVHRELQLIGALTTEIWIGTGAADFFFQEVQGAFINHGCAAQYSIATQDVLAFFIMQDQQGSGIVVQLQGYDIVEISTPKIVSEFKSYLDLSDAIGMCFQIEDHSYYAIVFPTANKGWLYDLTTSTATGSKVWSEWNWTDGNGNLNRPRANCCMFAYGSNLVGDWETGNLLKLDINTYTDYTDANTVNTTGAVGPITRIITFPHMINNNFKVTYKSFDVDIETGTSGEGLDPQIYLSWSNDKGKTYGNQIAQSMGMIGDYLAVPAWNRLGQARDRIFKLSWSEPLKTSINGAFVEFTQSSA
jgi:hypothetical protein